MSNYKKIFLFVIIFSFTGRSVLFTQQKFDFSQFAEETSKFIAKPFHWDDKDFLIAGGVVLGTAAIMQFDKDIKAEMMKDRSYENKGLMRFGTFYGDATPHLALGTGLLAFGYIADNDYTKQFGYELIQAISYTGAVTLILKSVIGRGRPSAVDGAFEFSPMALTKGDRYQSLPSGHSSVSFAVSTVFASKFKNFWLKALCYVPAVITAYSRVYNNRHWASDVFLGAFIGYFIGKFVVDMHDDTISSDSGSLISLKVKL